jgi:hypothetical protein
MKFLCLRCDQVMAFAERQLPGDGTFAAVFACESCGHEMAMLANPMETQLVSSLGVRIGGRVVPEQPLEFTRTGLAEARPDAFVETSHIEAPETTELDDGVAGRRGGDFATEGSRAESTRPDLQAPGHIGGAVRWSSAASDRLERVPGFVRGMVKRIYADWARQRGITIITPEVMDRARTDLGLESM